MGKVMISPVSTGLWQVDGEWFNDILRRTQRLEREGKVAQACELRFEGAQQLLEAVGDEAVRLDWNDSSSRAAMEVLYRSAADHMMIGEVEMAAALWESLLELDEEDHLEAVVPLAFAYVEIEDYDCLEGAMFDISPKSAEYQLLLLWTEYRRSGGIDRDALRQLRTRHKAWYEEFTADHHPADEEYLKDCRNERPSPTTEARELWFATEAMWSRNAEFIMALKKA
ncbi:MAG: hypothetical protein IJA57_01015 [Alistipes sp.]|nr:hypothetical protein [Alistipes sp.]